MEMFIQRKTICPFQTIHDHSHACVHDVANTEMSSQTLLGLKVFIDPHERLSVAHGKEE